MDKRYGTGIISSFLLCVCLSSGLQAQEKLVVVQSSGKWMSQVLASRVLETAYRRLGIEIVIMDYPAERALFYTCEGRLSDGIMARMGGLERMFPTLVCVPVPIAYTELMAYTIDPGLAVSTWESLRPYRIVYLRGNKKAEIMTQGMNVVSAATPEQAFKLLISGRVDVLVESRDVWDSRQLIQSGIIYMREPPLEILPMYHYLNEKHADLVEPLTAVLIKMSQNGDFNRIMNEVSRSFQ